MAKYAAAIDQGTTGTRFMVFSHEGTVVCSDYAEHEQIYPAPGLVEHDPMEVWERTQAVTKGALEKGGINAADLAAIGITNQRETAVVWEKATGKTVFNAIVWQDTRTREICKQLIDEGFEDTAKQKTGLVIATYFSGPKVKWILDNVDGARRRAENGELLFGNMDTWVIRWLTGGPNGGSHVTDYTNASRTMLMDLRKLEWDDEIMRRLGIPRQMLPEIRPSSDPDTYGSTLSDGALGRSIPVCGDLGDQQAAVFGQTAYNVGEAKNTYGTGNFMLLNTAGYGLKKGECIYALEGSIAVTGAAVQWLRDNLKIIANAAETEQLAQEVEDSGGAYFVPAFSGLFAPYWDMYARGAIVGLTRYVDRRHLVRATLEAVCYQTLDVAEAMEQDSGVAVSTLKVDGGMVVNNFLMQLQADILGTPVVRPTVSETTALGASYAAGLAVGFWESLDELRKNWQVDRTWEPGWSDEQRAAGRAKWKKAVERTREGEDKEPAAGP